MVTDSLRQQSKRAVVEASSLRKKCWRMTQKPAKLVTLLWRPTKRLEFWRISYKTEGTVDRSSGADVGQIINWT